jgi:hypothetical protein
MSFEADRWPGEIHLFVACFDNPLEFIPRVHVFVEEQLPWLHLADGLPRYAKTTTEGEAL